MAWLSGDFVHPERMELPSGHHLRPIRAADVDIDYPAVMGSRVRLWEKYGEAWGWPPATASRTIREDLAPREREIATPKPSARIWTAPDRAARLRVRSGRARLTSPD
jgi:DMSO/TMAO reductase YedYZ molybdopterin-dependent catalytic subunit